MRPLLAGDTVSYWLGAGRAELRGQRAAAEGPAASSPSDLGNLYLSTNKRGPDGAAAHGAAAPGRRARRVDEPADHQAPGPAAARRHLRERRGPARPATSAPTCRRSSSDDDAAARLPLRRRRPAAGHAGVVPGGAGGARPRDHLHLPDPRVAVRELHAAGRDHGVAAVLADRRVPRAAAHRHDAQHLLDHRLHHADGPRHEERDPAGRLRQPRAPRRRGAARRAAATRARCACGRS